MQPEPMDMSPIRPPFHSSAQNSGLQSSNYQQIFNSSLNNSNSSINNNSNNNMNNNNNRYSTQATQQPSNQVTSRTLSYLGDKGNSVNENLNQTPSQFSSLRNSNFGNRTSNSNFNLNLTREASSFQNKNAGLNNSSIDLLHNPLYTSNSTTQEIESVEASPKPEYYSKLNQPQKRSTRVSLPYDQQQLQQQQELQKQNGIDLFAPGYPSAQRALFDDDIQIELPKWIYDRKYLNGDYILDQQENIKPINTSNNTSKNKNVDKNIQNLNIKEFEGLAQYQKENLLMQDLLYALIGISGTFITTVQTQSSQQLDFSSQLKFQTHPSVPQYLSELIQPQLDICNNALIVQRYVDKVFDYQKGRVHHALSEALEHYLIDLKLLVVQLETQWRQHSMPLQGVHSYTNQVSKIFDIISSLVIRINEESMNSRQVLDLLYFQQRALNGDLVAVQIINKLLIAAARPYFQVLTKWLLKGNVDDPFGEFMIEEKNSFASMRTSAVSNDTQSKQSTWNEKFSVRLVLDTNQSQSKASNPATDRQQQSKSRMIKYIEDVPSVLEKVKSEILMSGKYINAIKQAKNTRSTRRTINSSGSSGNNNNNNNNNSNNNNNKNSGISNSIGNNPGNKNQQSLQNDTIDVDEPQKLIDLLNIQNEDIEYDPQQKYLMKIQQIFEKSSKAILDILVHRLNLVGHLRSMKHYFLLDQGDFWTTFLDIAEEELIKDIQNISKTRLQSLLELALKTSTLAIDEYNGRVGFTIDSRSVLDLSQQAREPKVQSSYRQNTVQYYHNDRLDQRMKDLSCMELFMISYDTSWPLSIVVSPRQIIQYQLLFRLIFQLRLAERHINQAWQYYQDILSTLLQGVMIGQQVQQKMLLQKQIFEEVIPYMTFCQHAKYFVQQYLQFLVFEIFEPTWTDMEKGIRKAKNLDQVILEHRNFLDRILKDWGGRSAAILNHITEIFKVIKQFYLLSKKILNQPQQQNLSGENSQQFNGVPLRIRQERQREFNQMQALKLRQALNSTSFRYELNEMVVNFRQHLHGLQRKLHETYAKALVNPGLGQKTEHTQDIDLKDKSSFADLRVWRFEIEDVCNLFTKLRILSEQEGSRMYQNFQLQQYSKTSQLSQMTP